MENTEQKYNAVQSCYEFQGRRHEYAGKGSQSSKRGLREKEEFFMILAFISFIIQQIFLPSLYYLASTDDIIDRVYRNVL